MYNSFTGTDSKLTKVCPNCGGLMTVKTGNWGKFWGCQNYQVNKCKSIKFVFEKVEVEVNDGISHIIPTIQQEKIINAVKLGLESIRVDAAPGCGKSTLLQYCYIKFLKNSGKDILAVTLMTRSAEDLQAKGIDIAKTVNSVTYGITKKVFPKSKLKMQGKNPIKIRDIILECGLIAEDDRKKSIKPLEKIISFLDSFMLKVSLDNVNYLINEQGYNFEIDINEDLINVLTYIENKRIEQRPMFFDFDESLKIAVENPSYAKKYDYILLDEAQDNNKIKQALIKSWLKPNGVLIAVGDENQSIMGFTGADSDAMKNLKDLFGAVSYPMNETRRTPAEIVDNYLNVEFPEIEFTTVKAGGKFIPSLDENFMMDSLIEDKNAYIICRNNSNLVKPAYAMIKAGYNACILGIDIAQELINLIANNKGHDVEATLTNIKKYVDGKFEQFKNAKNKEWLNDLQDKEETIKSIAEGCTSIDEILLKIDSLFSDNKADYTFLTGHKSKGLESNNVYLYRLDLLYKNSKTDKERKQERNLHWVMATRSLNKLVIIQS